MKTNQKIEYGYNKIAEEDRKAKNKRDWTRIEKECYGDLQSANVTINKYGDVKVDAPCTLSELLW